MEIEEPLIKLCAWCPESDRVTELFRKSGQLVSHSICRSCVRKMEAELDSEPLPE